MKEFWAEFFLVLGVEAALLVLAALLIQHFIAAALWKRTIWRACFVSLGLLLCCELFGARSTMQGLAARREPPARVSPAAAPIVSAAPILENVTADVGGARIHNPPSRAESGQTWWPGIVWLAGVALLGILGLGRRILLAVFRRRCEAVVDPDLLRQVEKLSAPLLIKRRVRTIASMRLVSPIAFGVLRPTICVPTNFAQTFTPSEQEAVLMHELAHIAARDAIWQWMADIVVALFWWHPLAWWAQRELRNSTEAAADETSALLTNGPQVLAQCLVNLGTRFTDRAGFKALGIHDVRFRSGLGKRVQRLFKMASNQSNAAPVQHWQLRAAQFCVPIIGVAAIVTCGAWATTTKGENMRTWKRSLAGLAAVSLLQTVQAEPGEKAQPVAVAANKAATPAKSDPAPLATLSEINAASKKTQLMRSKLESIVLDQVAFDSLPLGEVVRSLMEESRKRDPEKRGVNFVFAQPRFSLAAAIDPATGLPAKGPAETIDLKSITIRVDPPLTRIRLIDVLEVIRRVADHPIEYTVHEYGVVVAATPTPGVAIIPETVHPTVARTFKIDPQVFFPAVTRTFGVTIDTRTVDSARSGLAAFLAALGIDIYAPNRSVFYNELNGMLLVRATEEEMILVNAAMLTLGADGIGQ